jgi:hypothetical protein
VKRLPLTVIACLAAAVLAGCSDSRTGSPLPATGEPTGAQTSSTAAPPKSTSAQTADRNDPCKLMTSAEATGLGFGAGKLKTIPGGAKQCEWKTSKAGEGVGVGFGPNPLEVLNGQSIEIGKHSAAKLPPDPVAGGCNIGIGLPDSTTVILVGTSGNGKDEEVCPLVIQVAKTIDPKLP